MKSAKKKVGSEQTSLTKWADQNGDFDEDEEEDEPGFFSKYCGCCSALWATKDMHETKDRVVYVRTTLRELVIYVIFLIILAIITFGMTGPVMYFFTKVMMELFLDSKFPDTKNTFRGSSQVMDIWRFSENILLDNLYWEYWYNKDEKGFKDKNENMDHRRILFQNHLLGLARIKQVRVTNGSCSVPTKFDSLINDCYAPYKSKHEDNEPFSPEGKTTWNYTSKADAGSSTYWGKLASYDGGGYYVDLPKNRKETRELLARLKEERWIDRGTRVVTIDFSTYNANINLFCVVTLGFELPATGGLIPSFSFHTVKLLRYVTKVDYAIMAAEILFAIYILYYIIEEILEIKHQGKYYFYSFWNLLDIVVIGMSIACVVYSVFRYMTIKSKLTDLMETDNQYTDFSSIGFWQTQFNNVIAITTFLAWIKLFKYISFNRTMAQLNATLATCGKDLLAFAVMFMIVFLAYAQAGYLIFGTQVYDYSTYGMAVFTLMRIILGDFNFAEIKQANRILGPIFFVTYIFFVFFVLLNMFLAIINDTYSDVKDRKSTFKNAFEISDYLKKGYNNLMGKMGKRNKLIDIQNAILMAGSNNEGIVTYDTVRGELKKHSFSDMEVELLFSRFDVDGDMVLDDREQRIMLAQLEGDQAKLDREIANYERETGKHRSYRPDSAISFLSQDQSFNTTKEDMDELKERVEKMEDDMDTIGNKIDVAVKKLEAMGMNKRPRITSATSQPSQDLSKWDSD